MPIRDQPLFNIKPLPALAGTKAYSVPKHGAPTDLKLDANEGEAPSPQLLRRMLEIGPDLMRRYPDASGLQRLLAQRFGVDSDQVIVTAGADDALDRLCRAVLMPGRTLLTTDPSFEMLPRYARIVGAEVREVDWPGGEFPLEGMLEALTENVALIAIVSPNNPSGAVASGEVIGKLRAAKPDCVVLLDHAYVEFADQDFTEAALEHPNVIVVRTLSKAWGLAGLRVGYAIGPSELIGWMRASGGPYAVSRPSLALAAARLESDRGEMNKFVKQVREDRAAISACLRDLGAEVPDSQGNFVFAMVRDALWLRDALAGQGIAIRAYPGHPRLNNALRITCPGDEIQTNRVVHAIRQALVPEALLFNLEGALIDTSRSVNKAVELTARHLGADDVDVDQVAELRARLGSIPGSILVLQLLKARGIAKSPEEIQNVYDTTYYGTGNVEGLARYETLLLDDAALTRLSGKLALGIVTYRTRDEAEAFLDRHNARCHFSAMIAAEDLQGENTNPYRLLMDKFQLARGWVVGDTLGDIEAARAAHLMPIGVVPSVGRAGEYMMRLTEAGAARVLNVIRELEALVP